MSLVVPRSRVHQLQLCHLHRLSVQSCDGLFVCIVLCQTGRCAADNDSALFSSVTTASAAAAANAADNTTLSFAQVVCSVV